MGGNKEREREKRMNQNPQSSEGRNDDDSALSDFLASLMDYTPTVTYFPFLPSSSFFLFFYFAFYTGTPSGNRARRKEKGAEGEEVKEETYSL